MVDNNQCRILNELMMDAADICETIYNAVVGVSGVK